MYSPAHLAAQIGIVSQGHSAADVHDQQLNDSSIGPVLKAKERGATPNLDEVKHGVGRVVKLCRCGHP